MFTIFFILTLLTMVITKLWLASRQIRYVIQHRHAVPLQFQQTIALTTHQRAADYTVAHTRVAMAETFVSAVTLVALTLLGGLQWLAAHITHWLGQGYLGQITLIVAVIALVSIVHLPFTYFHHFVIEERFGFNRMTKALFSLDLIKTVIIGAMFGLPLLFALLWLTKQTGDTWWLWGWGIWMAFNLLTLVLYPVLIAPFFNRFEPLYDDTLRARIEALLKRCQFAAKGLFVMDGSRRSTHSNAYFSGLGTSKRIILFDTLVKRLTCNEIEAVLAHELGHFKRRHIVKRLAVIFVLSFALFALLGWVAPRPWFYTDLGVAPPFFNDHNGHATAVTLVLFLLVLPVFSFFLSPISNLLSRQHEFEADAFAAKLTRADELTSALVKLHQENASTLTPDPFYSAFYYSHPPIAQRIHRLLCPT